MTTLHPNYWTSTQKPNASSRLTMNRLRNGGIEIQATIGNTYLSADITEASKVSLVDFLQKNTTRLPTWFSKADDDREIHVHVLPRGGLDVRVTAEDAYVGVLLSAATRKAFEEWLAKPVADD